MSQEVNLTKLDSVFDRHQQEEGALIPVLQDAQEIYGYLSEEVLVTVGKRLHIPMSRIFGVITFYAQFYLTPRGRHTVRVCRGTSPLRGSRGDLASLRARGSRGDLPPVQVLGSMSKRLI
ncbi:MAG: NAD(P)H-dependent oxidoreductase subunit E, partial [Desulfobacterales bacterium]|nr:NAD(P)H-dependent oxidoreductase subunit E [Desulfobacterales bacterium]